jgi:hypothetical protein
VGVWVGGGGEIVVPRPTKAKIYAGVLFRKNSSPK